MGEMADWLTEFCEWKPFDTAPKTQSDVIVWREDAGTFVARFCSPLTEDGEPLPENEWLWFTAEGEDLTDDLPTHWLVELDQIPEPIRPHRPRGQPRGHCDWPQPINPLIEAKHPRRQRVVEGGAGKTERKLWTTRY